MPASQEQKVDFLLKKIGYSASKTGIAEDESTISSGSNTPKKPFEEGIPSPLIIPQSSLWADSGYIPTTPPGSDTAYVKGYRTATALRMTRDATVGTNTRSYIAYTTYNNTSSARLTNWIDTQFGSSYILKVYKGDPNSSGVELQQAGANAGTDGWFFDYSSGILNFNGVNLPSGITATNIYIVGYRYIGATGARPPAGIGTFENLYVAGVSTFMGSIDANSNLDVAGISTFQGLIDANGLIEGIAGQNKIPSLYANYSDLPNASTYHGLFAHVHQHGRGYFAHGGAWFELVNKESDGRVGTGTETYNVGFLDATNLDVTGITTLGSIGISTGRITGPAITYIDPATVGDDTGTLVVKGNLQVEGTQTTVNSSIMTVTDKNIELAKGAANDAAADGGGITIDSGGGDKTWQWLDATDSWTSSEHIRIPDGKVFGFATDTNTYIGRPAADTIAFTHGGSERVRITSSQTRIGSQAATDTTSYEIQLSGATNNDSILSLYNPTNTDGEGINFGFFFNNTNGNATQFAKIESNAIETQANSTLAGDLRFYTADGDDSPNLQEKLRIESDGKVGIGSDNPQELLSLMADGPCGISLIDSGHGQVATTIKIGNTGKDLSINVPEDILTTLTNGNYKINTNGSERLRITGSTGNLGINSTAPAAKLDVNGTSQFQDDITIQSANGNNIVFDKSDNALKFGNDVEARFGLFQQFRIRQNGTSGNSEIIHNRPQILVLHSDKLDLRPWSSTGAVYLRATYNSSIDLYYANSKKFETTNTGVNITGITTTTQLEIGTLGQSLVGITTILDEDNFASNSAAALATQQSIKAYVDSSTPTGSNLAVSADSGSNESINLATEVLDIEGTANEIETATGTNKVVIGLPNDVSITNLTLGGSVSAGSTTGTNGYYLKTTGIGVTWAAFPSSRTTSTQTATAGQTSFNFSYNVGFLDVFVNGVKLPGSEFTASNGSTIVLDDAAFANDTLEFVSFNTVPNSSAGAQNLTGLADVTITGTPVIGETLQHNGSQFVNDYTVSTTTTSTSQTAILNLPVATYRSVEYTIQMTEGTKYHVTKVLAIHNGTNVYFNEYGTLFTNSSLSAFALDVNSGNIRLLATPASTNSTVFKVKFTGIKV